MKAENESVDLRKETYMVCQDILQMELFQNKLKLIAGKEGVNRTVRWIYFASGILQNKNKDEWNQWICGGEIIVATDIDSMEGSKNLIELLKKMNEKQIAGVIIDAEFESEELVECANQLALPLILISKQLKLIDFSREVSRVLLNEENEEDICTQILTEVLYEDDINESALLYKAAHNRIYLEQPHTILIFWCSQMKETILKIILGELHTVGFLNCMMIRQGDMAIALLETDRLLEITPEKLVDIVDFRLRAFLDKSICCGMGKSYSKISQYKKSFDEAKKALKTAQIKETKLVKYQDVGVYELLMHVKDEEFLDAYVEKKLGKLMRMDKSDGGELCETLRVYLSSERNIKISAEKLFIHRNTMRYRLDKIEEILNEDFDKMENSFEYELAFYIIQYRRKM